MVKLVILACAAAGCTAFEDPDIVIDIRVLGMSATLPEQVIDIDLANPPTDPNVLVNQMHATTVCALVADPTNARQLRWTMTLCPQNDSERCYDDHPQTVIGMDIAADPETTTPTNLTLPGNCIAPDDSINPGCMCAIVNPNSDLLAVVLDALNNDPLHGFQGLDYAVSLQVGGEAADPNLDQYAEKALRIAARVPSDREANNNPKLQQLQGQIDAGPFIIPFGRCADTQSPLEVAPGTSINLFPVEPDGVRETYVIPTLDGGSEMFTESLTYQWNATGGGFSRGSTGGPRDTFGNDAPLDTDWAAPSDVTEPTDFSFWLVQRDERLGEDWYEFCLRVVPP
jgi:hypothetical protein